MMPYTFKTTLTLDVFNGSITELDLVVIYTATKGTPASYGDPGSPDEIEIIGLRLANEASALHLPAWLDDLICDDESLKLSLHTDWQEQRQEAAEYAAEARREERMLEGRL